MIQIYRCIGLSKTVSGNLLVNLLTMCITHKTKVQEGLWLDASTRVTPAHLKKSIQWPLFPCIRKLQDNNGTPTTVLSKRGRD